MAADGELPALPSEAEVEKQTAEDVKEEQQLAPAGPPDGLPVLPVAETPKPEAEVVPPVVKPEPLAIKTMPKKIEPKTPQPEPQKVMVETKPQKVVVEHTRRGIGCSCRTISCTGCLIIVALIVAIIYIVIARPPAIVNPIKVWLNDGLQATINEGTTPEAALAAWTAQGTNFKVGDNDLVVKQDELRALIQSKVGNVNAINVQILSGKIKLYVNGDTNTDVPLWLVGEIASEDGQHLHLTKLGTERIGLPTFMNDFLTRVIFSVLNLAGNKQASSDDLISAVLPLPSTIQLKSLKMEPGVLTITLHLDSGLENIFTQQ